MQPDVDDVQAIRIRISIKDRVFITGFIYLLLVLLTKRVRYFAIYPLLKL